MKIVTKKNDNDKEKYFNIEELMEIMKLDERSVLCCISTGGLREQHFVSEGDLKAFLEQKKLNAERLARLEARSAEAGRIFEAKSAGMVENSSFRGQEKDKRNFKTWELKGL